MAGPGGGPPRRSHTKSRKGCDTCKKRHIRCDESFPQCRNCTKHKIRCPYNDIPVPEDRAASPDKPDLMWTPEIEAEIELWRQTGVFPYPSLNIYPAPSPQGMSIEDLRLIHHLASISYQLGNLDANGFTLWTRQIPLLLRIAATNGFVLKALLAFSAMHIAFLTDCPIVGNLAYVHRGAALKGLQEAISTFGRETSDAVLAASLVLSWQATDWRSWTQLMQGTSTIMDAMALWKEESQFGEFIKESSTFPTAPPSPRPDHKTSQPRKEDWDAYNRMLAQLQKLESYLKQNREDTKSVQQLVAFLKGARKVSPTLSIAQQFERLRPLRTWLFWIPVLYLQQSSGSFTALMVIAHYYAVALLMERLFPEIGSAYFGSLSMAPTEEIARRLLSIQISGAQGTEALPFSLINLPVDTVKEFRARMGWEPPLHTQSFPQFDPQFDPPNFYVSSSGDSPISIPSTTVADGLPYSPYAESPTFSYSTEDLSSMVTPESGPNSAISPVQLASPYGQTQYLNIPSPSYGGYSPVSSTANDFGEGSSIVYSETEELFSPSSFDMPFTASAPGLGAGSAFGVGFVPPMQTVWI